MLSSKRRVSSSEWAKHEILQRNAQLSKLAEEQKYLSPRVSESYLCDSQSIDGKHEGQVARMSGIMLGFQSTSGNESTLLATDPAFKQEGQSNCIQEYL